MNLPNIDTVTTYNGNATTILVKNVSACSVERLVGSKQIGRGFGLIGTVAVNG